MEKLNFDSGVKEYRINGGSILRFNPSDPNLYARFLDSLEQIKILEQELTPKAQMMEAENDQSTAEAVLRLMQEADKKIKKVLTDVFGAGNDFEQILGNVNLLALASNGERVITNFLSALQPVLSAGAQSYAKQRTDDAVARAKGSRARRGAK